MKNSFGNKSEVFLITTANEEFWSRDRPIVFLSEACKLYSRREIWENLDFETFRYCLDTAEKIQPGLDIYFKVFDKALDELTRVLNQFHKIDKEVKYYKIILGPWLLGFIPQLYEKYIVLKKFQKSFPEFNTFLISKDQRYIPLDLNDFDKKMYTDEYALQIYSEILEILGFRFQYKSLAKPLLKNSVFATNGGIIRGIHRGISSIHRRMNRAMGRRNLSITSPFCSLKDMASFVVKNRLKYVLDEFYYPVKIPVKVDLQARDSFCVDLGDSEFEKLLTSMLFKHLPFIYLEGFKGMRKTVGQVRAFPGDVCFTGVGILGNPVYAFFIAENYHEITLLIHQHGAGYGYIRDSITEHIERGIADRYYTWGWKGEKCQVLPHPKVCGPWNENPGRKGLLLVLTCQIRYLKRLMYRAGGASFLAKFIDPLFVFLDNLCEDIEIFIRLYPLERGWKIPQRIMDRYPGRVFKFLSGDWESNMYNSKICVHPELCSTTFLETLARNIPTISYYDPSLHRMTDVAEKHTEDLIKAEIVHRSPKQAAIKLNGIFDDPETWWNEPVVQEARSGFIEQFARTSNNWQADWAKEFDEVLEHGV